MTYNLQLTPVEVRLLISAIDTAKTQKEADIGSYSSYDLFNYEEQLRLEAIEKRLRALRDVNNNVASNI